MQLTTYLLRLARIWSEVSERTLVALSTQVANDGKLFRRIEQGGDIKTATFERFLSFFRDGSNWPDMRIPQPAADLLDALENIAGDERASTGKMSVESRGVAA